MNETICSNPAPVSAAALLPRALRNPWKALSFAACVLHTRWKLRRATSVGAWVRADGRMVIYNGGELHLGERVFIRATHVAVELAAMPGGVLSIGSRTYINSGVSICAQQSVSIGENCAIGP